MRKKGKKCKKPFKIYKKVTNTGRFFCTFILKCKKEFYEGNCYPGELLLKVHSVAACRRKSI